MGYGEPDLTTMIGFGSNVQSKHMTAYFRRTFEVDAVPVARRLALSLRVDDGAVVYLNGQEIARVNMPAGAIGTKTPSQRAIAGADESRYVRRLAPVKDLVPGRNVMAVEVHQCEPASSDLIFDLELALVPDPPIARVTPAAREVSLLYVTKHYIPPGQRIPDGYVDGGRGMKIGNDDVVRSEREVIVVDRSRDALLRQHLSYARSPWLAALPTMERAKLLALYVDQVCSPPNSRAVAWSNVEEIQTVYQGREFMFGQLVSSGVCRHRALLFKLLGDEAGLPVALVRGNAAADGGTVGHAWNELLADEGEKLIVDVAGPRPGFRFPTTTERGAEAYLTIDNRPYYAKSAATTVSGRRAAATSREASSGRDDSEGRLLLQAAQHAVAEYHRGSTAARSLVRVVYFHPADRDPLPNYAARLDRIMTDVSDFYRDGLRRFGIENRGLPLERKDGRLVLHLVRGKLPASGYNYEAGGVTGKEARAALQGVVDFDREHVLMVYGLCRKEPDGRYVFDAPYYGDGNQRAGLCHAADCELLDPSLLTDTKNKIVYTEHYYPRVEQMVATFNSWYIGGLAHELGHGLGLPHDAGQRAEAGFGTSLMGNGNLRYREDVWGGRAPAYLSRTIALQLLAHPLITGSDRGRWEGVGVGIEGLEFVAGDRALQVRGRAGGTIPPYAVAAFIWPTSSKQDHGARTFATVVRGNDFDLRLDAIGPGSYNLKLVTMHANGGTTTRRFQLDVDSAGRPDAKGLQARWESAVVERGEQAVAQRWPAVRTFLSDEVIARAPGDDARRKLRHLRTVVEPVTPQALGSITGERVYLSDVAWSEASVGWGQPARNHFWFDEKIQRGVLISVGGQFFERSLYAHSPSRYVFPLEQKWKTFTVVIGLRDGAVARKGSGIFTIRGDGRELYRSSVMRVGTRNTVNVDVSGVRQLELLAEGDGGNSDNSWAIWADPLLQR